MAPHLEQEQRMHTSTAETSATVIRGTVCMIRIGGPDRPWGRIAGEDGETYYFNFVNVLSTRQIKFRSAVEFQPLPAPSPDKRPEAVKVRAL